MEMAYVSHLVRDNHVASVVPVATRHENHVEQAERGDAFIVKQQKAHMSQVSAFAPQTNPNDYSQRQQQVQQPDGGSDASRNA